MRISCFGFRLKNSFLVTSLMKKKQKYLMKPHKSKTIEEIISSDPELINAVSSFSGQKKAFEDRISKIMADKNLDQADLAELVGITQSTVQAMISGQHKPQPKTLSSLASSLGVSSDNLWPEFVRLIFRKDFPL